MNYKKLANEYLEEADRLKLHINSVRKQNKSQKCTSDRGEYYRIKKLYTMYLELKHMGEYLSNKYGG